MYTFKAALRRVLRDARVFNQQREGTPEAKSGNAAASVLENTLTSPPVVVIEVRGGCVSAVRAKEDLRVVLIDHDNIAAGDPKPELLSKTLRKQLRLMPF